MAVFVPMPRPTPIYMLGDSHIFALSDRLFRTSWGELVEFRALYCRDLRTRDFVRPGGALDPRIQEALRVARIGPKRWVLTENATGHRSSIGPPMSLDEDDVDRNYRSAGFPPAPRSSMLAWRSKTFLILNAALRRVLDIGCGRGELSYAFAADGVSLSAPSAPQQVRAGEPFVAEITLRNDGPRPLTSFAPNPIRFAYVWSNGDVVDAEQAFAAGSGRSRVEPVSQSGSTRRYGLAVVAPREPGPHVPRVTLLQEMVQWFDVEVQLAIDVA